MESNALPTPVLILWNIRSNENVGSLFRTADAVGIKKLYLVGITPPPIDRFGRPVNAIAKTALGAERTLSWDHTRDDLALITDLKSKGYTVIAIEQSSTSTDYKKVHSQPLTAFIVGNEVAGLPPSLLSLADTIAEIPMSGTKESLNVAVAGGIALFRMLGK